MKYGVIKQGSQLKFTIIKPFYQVNWKLLLKRQPLTIKPDIKLKGKLVHLTYRLEAYYFHDYFFEKEGVDYELLLL